MANTRTLKAAFALNSGKAKSYSLPDPRPDLDAAAVQPVLQAFVDGDLIRVGEAQAVSVKSAVVREVSETVLI